MYCFLYEHDDHDWWMTFTEYDVVDHNHGNMIDRYDWCTGQYFLIFLLEKEISLCLPAVSDVRLNYLDSNVSETGHLMVNNIVYSFSLYWSIISIANIINATFAIFFCQLKSPFYQDGHPQLQLQSPHLSWERIGSSASALDLFWTDDQPHSRSKSSNWIVTMMMMMIEIIQNQYRWPHKKSWW